MIHFVDVGAHKGSIAQRVVDLGLDVHLHLFEPSPSLMELLKVRFENNSQVSLYEKAFHSIAGTALMYEPNPLSQSSSLYGIKKTSVNAPTITVDTVDGAGFLRSLLGPIILYSNCEGSEFDFVPDILKDSELCARIKMWSVSFHHGQHKIPEMKPLFVEINNKMCNMGIENIEGHFDFDGKHLDEFIDKVVGVINEQT